MEMRALPPVDLLRSMLDYDPADGKFTWKPRSDGTCFDSKYAGLPAGSKRAGGYVMISINGYGIYGAHRLAWAHYHGRAPDGEIDHRDQNPSNNAIDNLRPASSSQQKMNKRVQSNNRSGLKGAYFHACRKGQQWRSQIKFEGRLIFIGYFDTAQAAHEAYMRKSAELFGEFHPKVVSA